MNPIGTLLPLLLAGSVAASADSQDANNLLTPKVLCALTKRACQDPSFARRHGNDCHAAEKDTGMCAPAEALSIADMTDLTSVASRIDAYCPLIETNCANPVGEAEEFCPVLISVCSEVTELRDTGFNLRVDQDVFDPASADKDFTQGTEFEWSGARTKTWVPRGIFNVVDAPFRLFVTDAFRKKEETDFAENNSFSWGFSGFTPRKGEKNECLGYSSPRVTASGTGCILSDPNPRYDDRPYAGLLYVRVRRQVEGLSSSWVSDLTLGLLGTRIGEGFQWFIHKNLSNDVRPGGWKYQISNGGELTGKYRAAYRRGLGARYWSADAAAPCWIDLASDLEGSAGYYTNLSGSARVRVGLIRSSRFGQETHGSSPYVVKPAHVRPAHVSLDTEEVIHRPAAGNELFVWAEYGYAYWFYNALLQGQFRDQKDSAGKEDPTTVHLRFGEGPAPLRHHVRTWQAGVKARFGRFAVTYSLTWHSPLFDGPNTRRHSWGSLIVSHGPRFGNGR